MKLSLIALLAIATISAAQLAPAPQQLEWSHASMAPGYLIRCEAPDVQPQTDALD